MSKCKGCGKEYNYIYDLCPACRGVKHHDLGLICIDDLIDLEHEHDIVTQEMREQDMKDGTADYLR